MFIEKINNKIDAAKAIQPIRYGIIRFDLKFKYIPAPFNSRLKMANKISVVFIILF